MSVLHAGRGRAAERALGAAVARRAAAAGARVRGARRAQAAPHGRRAHAARRPARRRAGTERAERSGDGGHDEQRPGADAAPARAAARRPVRAQPVAGLAARRALRADGAPPGAVARARELGPRAAARLALRQNQHRAHERIQRRRNLRLRGADEGPRGGREVHRVHAVRGQQVGGLAHGVGARGAGGRAAPPPRAARRRARAVPHRHDVAGAGLPRPRGLHLVHEQALLRLLQPPAPHGRRKPQGVPVRRGGEQPARRAARRRGRARAGGAGARRAAPQAQAARRDAEPRARQEPADDSDRRLIPCVPSTAAAARGLCSRASDAPAPPARLTHVDAEGQARMVDVGGKPVTRREAEAECFVRVSAHVLRLLRAARLPKGDALTVAQAAGALGAKRTASLLPLCHPLPLELARVRLELPRGDGGGRVRVACECAATARTGVEMEALTGCAVAALALYDMCKAVDRGMVVEGLRVVRKAGGSTPWPPPPPPGAPRVRAHDTSPHARDETYAPTDVVHF